MFLKSNFLLFRKVQKQKYLYYLIINKRSAV